MFQFSKQHSQKTRAGQGCRCPRLYQGHQGRQTAVLVSETRCHSQSHDAWPLSLPTGRKQISLQNIVILNSLKLYVFLQVLRSVPRNMSVAFLTRKGSRRLNLYFFRQNAVCPSHTLSSVSQGTAFYSCYILLNL